LLMPSNPAYKPIRVNPESLEIWGVVTFALNQFSHVHAR
ncbi:peptidase, partial [Salmonella enterica subsp. enterica serovar Kentucky]